MEAVEQNLDVLVERCRIQILRDQALKQRTHLGQQGEPISARCLNAFAIGFLSDGREPLLADPLDPEHQLIRRATTAQSLG